MYILLLLMCFFSSAYGYFIFKNKNKRKSIKNIRLKYFLWILSCLLLILLALDLPYFFYLDREMDISLNNVRIISTGNGRKSIDLITIYEDDSGKNYWSGVPIGHEEWTWVKDRNGITRVCRIKYLPITRIVVTVTENHQIIYNNLMDILTYSMWGSVLLIVYVISIGKDSIFGVKNSK